MQVTKLTKVLSKHSPTILTGLGIFGFASSIIMAVKATPKAMTILDDELSEMYKGEGNGSEFYTIEVINELDSKGLSFNERFNLISLSKKFELTWPIYIPTAGMAVLSGASIILAQKISLGRQAVLASLYSLAQEGLVKYQEEVVEQLGEKKAEKIRGEISQKKLDSHPLPEDHISSELDEDKKVWCFESLSSRYFKTNVEFIRQIINDYNERLLSEMTLSLNELYFDLGLEGTTLGDKCGWQVEQGLLNPVITTKLKDNKPCLVLDIEPLPQAYWF